MVLFAGVLLLIILIRFDGLLIRIDIILGVFFLEVLIYTKIYSTRWFHVIILLIVLELFMLKIYFFSAVGSLVSDINIYFIFMFITLRVAEASVGIALLTLLIRLHGVDFLLSLRI